MDLLQVPEIRYHPARPPVLDPRTLRHEPTVEDWTLGSPSAPVTILEYANLECGHCARLAPHLEALVAELPEVVRIVFRHFPLTTVHRHAAEAAEAVEAAGAQGRFWEMLHLVLARRRVEPANMRASAAEVGCNLEVFDHALATHAHLPAIRRDVRRGLDDGVNDAPTLYINSQRYDGPRESTSRS